MAIPGQFGVIGGHPIVVRVRAGEALEVNHISESKSIHRVMYSACAESLDSGNITCDKPTYDNPENHFDKLLISFLQLNTRMASSLPDDTDINILVAQYFQQVPPPQLSLPDGPTLLQPAVQTALFERMFNDRDTDAETGTEIDTGIWPVPPVSYETRVLKMIITRLEESISDPDDEIIDDLMNTWSNLLTQPKSSSLEQAQQLAYIKYTAPPPSHGPLDQHRDHPRTVITSESRGLILSSGTTGFRTWEAALHLGTYLASTPSSTSLQGKRILELGAGTGFLSLLCAKHLNPEVVVVTDREPALIESIRDCAGKNRIKEGVLVPALWEWGGYVDSDAKREFDIAIGADLIYDKDLIPPLLSTLTTLFTNYNLQYFLISATLRNIETFQAFLDACETNTFKVEKLPFESPPEDKQMGFFHSTGIPIQMFMISR